MDIWCKKTYLGLIPASRTDFEDLQNAKLKDGIIYKVSVVKPRNYEFHKKFFALLSICFENQEYFDNAKSLRKYLTMKAGYYNEIITPTGSFFEPKSISFTSMDEIEFERYYNSIINQVLKIIDCDKEDLLNEIINF